MKRDYLVSAALALGLAIPSPISAIPDHYKMNVAGKQMTCRSWTGEPVRIVNNPSLATLGQAYSTEDGQRVLELNKAAVSVYSPKVQQWWFNHECAHHQLPPQLNSEKRADCMAIKRLTKAGGALSVVEAQAFRSELRFLPASSAGHLAGAERAKLVLKCAGPSATVTA